MRRDRWEQAGSTTLIERAHEQIAGLLKSYQPSRLTEVVRRDLVERMQYEARRHGLDRLPPRESH